MGSYKNIKSEDGRKTNNKKNKQTLEQIIDLRTTRVLSRRSAERIV